MFELAGRLIKSAIAYYCSAIINAIENASSVGEGVRDMVCFSSGSATAGSFKQMLEDIIETAMPFFEGVGIAIALMYAFIGIIILATNDQLTPEKMIKQLARFALSFGLIMYAKDICYGIINLGDWFATTVSTLLGVFHSGGVGADTGDTYKNLQNVYLILCTLFSQINHGALGDVGSSIKFMEWGIAFQIPTLFIHLATVACFFMALARGLELGIRTLFMPIPLGIMADEGWRGAGGRYIRKYMAVATQGMVMIAATDMMKEFLNGVINFVTKSIVSASLVAAEKTGIALNDSAVFEKIAADVGATYDVESMSDLMLKSGVQLGVTNIAIDSFMGPGTAQAVAGPLLWSNYILKSFDTLTASSGGAVFDAINGLCTRAIWVCIAVCFAAVGLIAKSMQIVSDVWGV